MGISWIVIIISGIAGGIAAYFKAMSMKQVMQNFPCPNCRQLLGSSKLGKRTRQQVLWGGWTCPNCGCDVDRHGKERKHPAGITDKHEWQCLKSDIEGSLSARYTYRDIIRRPQLLLLEPQIFVTKPWLVVILFALTGLLLGIVSGIQQGAPGDVKGVFENCLLGGFVGVVIATIVGGTLASLLWLVRAMIQILSRRT